LILAKRAAACRYMKMITLPKLRGALRELRPQVRVEPELAERALVPLERMVAITRQPRAWLAPSRRSEMTTRRPHPLIARRPRHGPPAAVHHAIRTGRSPGIHCGDDRKRYRILGAAHINEAKHIGCGKVIRTVRAAADLEEREPVFDTDAGAQ
jgi:hypothetical protein